MKKLLFIDHYGVTRQFPGITRNFDLCAGLARRGWSTTLFCSSFNHYTRAYMHRTPGTEQGVRVMQVPSTAYKGNSISREISAILFSCVALLYGLFVPTDVVVSTIPSLEASIAGLLIARLKGVPFVLNIEDLWPDSLIALGMRNKSFLLFFRVLERILYGGSSHILVVAESMKASLAQRGLDEDKVSMLPLGANVPEALIPVSDIRLRFGWSSEHIICGYVGSHGPKNSLETALRAAQQCPTSIRFVFFGDGPDKPRLLKLRDQLKLDNVEFHASVAPSEVPSIMRAFDIGIITVSRAQIFKEIRPTKLFDYMACGIPIACAMDGETRQLVLETNTGNVSNPEDYEGLAQAIYILAGDAPLRAAMGKNGIRYISQNADRDKLADILGQRLDQVISRHISS